MTSERKSSKARTKIYYDPDTEENMERRGEKLREIDKKLERASRKPTQQELSKIVLTFP